MVRDVTEPPAKEEDMNKVVEHTDGKVYLVDTTPEKKHFATIYELRPVRAVGIVAGFLEEYSGQEQYTYNQAILDDEDLIRVTLELGRKFSIGKAWRRLYDWAWREKKYQGKESQ